MLKETANRVSERWREIVLAAVGVATLAIAVSQSTVLRAASSHEFVDGRGLWGIPNFPDVVSNLPFLLVGILGLMMGRAKSNAPWSWGVFFVGLACVCFGSSYYHWSPDDLSLAWDRLPIAVGFMGLFVAILSEHVDKKVESWLLVPAVALGAGSVAWWATTGNLSLYAWVQFFPLLAVLLLLALYKGTYSHRGYLLIAFGFYGFAKVAELYDAAFFQLTGGFISGHTLKHLLAATGVYFIYRMLKIRSRK